MKPTFVKIADSRIRLSSIDVVQFDGKKLTLTLSSGEVFGCVATSPEAAEQAFKELMEMLEGPILEG